MGSWLSSRASALQVKLLGKSFIKTKKAEGRGCDPRRVHSGNKVHKMSITMSSKTGRPLEITSTDGTITLRQYSLKDAKAAFALIDKNREHLAQFGDRTGVKYPTLESFEESIRNPKNVNRLRFGIWNSKDELVGSINLTPDADNPRRGEIGFYLGGEFQGNGYMKRAVQALTDYAFKKLNYSQIYGKVAVGNEHSVRVLMKNGYFGSVKKEVETIYTISNPA